MLFPSSNLLADEAIAWVAKRARLQCPPLIVDPSEKWIVRSAFQKAVRRGQVDRAVDLALTLHRIDNRYVWRAVLTVAIEDVGFGSPDSVFWATHAQSSPFRKTVGELPLLIALTREMAAAPKSQAALQISFLANTTHLEAFRAFGRMSTRELVGRVEGADPFDCYAALGVLRGVTPPMDDRRPRDQAGVELAAEIMQDQLPPDLGRAAVASLLRPLDDMSIGGFPAFRLGHQTTDVFLRNDPRPESRVINGYASEAYDQHERAGRRAIRRFAADLLHDHSELRRLQASALISAVSDAIFLVEGQCLYQWRSGPELLRLRQETDRRSLSRHGVTPEQGEALCQTVGETVPILNRHREAVTECGREVG